MQHTHMHMRTHTCTRARLRWADIDLQPLLREFCAKQQRHYLVRGALPLCAQHGHACELRHAAWRHKRPHA